MTENKTPQGHIYFECDFLDLIIAGFGSVCDNCNFTLSGASNIVKSDSVKAYYIPVLNQVFCEECFNEWVKTAQHYDEDTEFEQAMAYNFREKFNS